MCGWVGLLLHIHSIAQGRGRAKIKLLMREGGGTWKFVQRYHQFSEKRTGGLGVITLNITLRVEATAAVEIWQGSLHSGKNSGKCLPAEEQ